MFQEEGLPEARAVTADGDAAAPRQSLSPLGRARVAVMRHRAAIDLTALNSLRRGREQTDLSHRERRCETSMVDLVVRGHDRPSGGPQYRSGGDTPPLEVDRQAVDGDTQAHRSRLRRQGEIRDRGRQRAAEAVVAAVIATHVETVGAASRQTGVTGTAETETESASRNEIEGEIALPLPPHRHHVLGAKPLAMMRIEDKWASIKYL
jgi:hypothetical protein